MNLREVIDEAEKNSRALISVQHALDLVEKAGLNPILDGERSDYCPFCGAEAKDSDTPFKDRETRKPYVIKPILKISRKDKQDKWFEVELAVPMMRDRAIAPPLFCVGMNNLITGIAWVLLGKKFKPKPGHYLGAGTSADHETMEAVKALRKNWDYIIAELLLED